MAWTVDSLSYTHRKKITVQGDYVDSDLTNFPLLVAINGDTDLGTNTNADGYDIRFTSSDGSTLLDYDREKHDVSAGALTAVYWVKVPSVAADGTTYIYIYYRSTDTADGTDAAGVWDEYEAVYHLGNGTTLSGTDATGNGRTLTVNNATANSGKVYGGSEHDGTNDYLYGSDVMDLGINDLTLSCWARWDSSPESYTGLMGKGYLHSNGYGYGLSCTSSTQKFGVQLRAGSTAYSSPSNSTTRDSTWYYVVGTFDRDGYLTLYVNGVAQSSPISISSLASTSLNDSFTFAIGSRSSGDGTYLYDLDGGLDECRVVFVARSAAWVKFEFYNQNETDGELTWDSQETAGSGGNSQWYFEAMRKA